MASALPLLKARWQGDPVVAAFDNLLTDAEGELREKIAARVGAQGKDVFSLLSVLGRDCVGALQFLPMDEALGEQDMQYRLISEEEMVADLRNLAAAPLAQGDDEDFRIFIAGAQEKTAYLHVDGQWAKPRGITPTSHNFKTPMGILPGPDQIDLSDSVENELFCMTLAREIGLPAAHVEKIVLPGQVVLSVETVRSGLAGGDAKTFATGGYLPVVGLPLSYEVPEGGRPRHRADHGAFAGIRYADRGS